MKIRIAIGLLLAANCGLPAQTLALKPVVSSASGQFSVLDRRGAPPPALPTTDRSRGYFVLEPALLVVSCERIRNALNSELGATAQWRGKIHITISPVRNTSDDYALVAERARDGWVYRLNLPQRVEQTMYVRTLVQALLLEMANRQAGERSAEIPFWLVEGLTQKLLSARRTELILAPPGHSIGGVNVSPTMFERTDQDQLEAARRVLRDHPPLTLEELSWPPSEGLSGTDSQVYQCSAQLFVTELLRLNNGRESLRHTLSGLAGCYNWQTAFLKAFPSEFPSQLALAKWWTLQVMYFVGRNPQQLWTAEESYRKLDEALHAAVAVRQTSGELPVHAEVTLQAIIREWNTLRQLTTFRDKLRELELTRVRIAPEYAALTDEYLRVLQQYVQARERHAAIYANLNALPSGQRRTALDIIRQLDELDASRQAARPRQPEAWSAVPPPSPEVPRPSATTQ